MVTDDRPFLVDTVTMELTRQDWSLRRLYHPQLRVQRDASGHLTSLTADADAGIAESWIAVEIYPPLGAAAESLSDAAGRRDCARRSPSVTVAVEDWQPMLQRARAAVEELRDDHTPAGSEAVALLEWLAADHFVFLGYADYEPVRRRPRPGAGQRTRASCATPRRPTGSPCLRTASGNRW